MESISREPNRLNRPGIDTFETRTIAVSPAVVAPSPEYATGLQWGIAVLRGTIPLTRNLTAARFSLLGLAVAVRLLSGSLRCCSQGPSLRVELINWAYDTFPYVMTEHVIHGINKSAVEIELRSSGPGTERSPVLGRRVSRRRLLGCRSGSGMTGRGGTPSAFGSSPCEGERRRELSVGLDEGDDVVEGGGGSCGFGVGSRGGWVDWIIREARCDFPRESQIR